MTGIRAWFDSLRHPARASEQPTEPAPTGRILADYESVEVGDLREAILQALGAASVCWEPMDCTGVFREDRATQIAYELFEICARWCNGRDRQPSDLPGAEGLR